MQDNTNRRGRMSGVAKIVITDQKAAVENYVEGEVWNKAEGLEISSAWGWKITKVIIASNEQVWEIWEVWSRRNKKK